MELTLMDKIVQQLVHVEHTEMTTRTSAQIVTTHAYVVLDPHIKIVPLVMMVLIGMKENVELFAQQDTGKMILQIHVKDVMEVVSLVPEEKLIIVKNHAQILFTGMMDTVSIFAQKVLMKTMQQSKLVKIVT